MPRRLATTLTLVVALLWGALPLRECLAGGLGGIVVAGEHVHDGACHGCACTACDPHADGACPDAEAACPCGSATCAHPTPPPAGDGERPDAPHGGPRPAHDGGCCVDEAGSIVRTGVELALPADRASAALAVVAPAAPTTRRASEVAASAPDDGPPPGVVTVVLLR